jgi:TonB-linked SusC/RagA family outer membrane protein
VYSDFEGVYAISAKGTDSLIFSSLEFGTKTVGVGGRSVIDVGLTPLVQQVDGVVVTALGIKRDEKALGYAVTTIDGDDIRKSNQTNIANSLNGVVAGANVTNSSGAAGAGSRVVLRGYASLTGNNEALYVIDGVKVNNDTYGLGGENSTESVSNSNRGIDINPEDIESMSVLKGGAATALYGIDGANGVILITTKKGKAMEKGTVYANAGSSITVSQVNKLPTLQNRYAQGTAWYSADGFTPEYYSPETGWLTSWGPSVDELTYDSGTANDYDQNGTVILKPSASDPSINTYDNLGDFFRTGITAKNNFTVGGGNKIATYRLSVSDVRQSGIVPLNTFKRTNVNFASGMNFFDDKLTLNTSVNYINSGGRRVQQGSNLSGIMLGLLRTPVSFDNSNGLDKPWNNPESFEFADGSQRNYRGGGGYDNPFWSVAKNPFNDNVNRVIGNIQASYEFSKWATLGVNIGVDKYGDRRRQSYAVGSRAFPNGKIVEQFVDVSQTDAYLTLTVGDYLNDDKTIDLTYTVGLNAFSYSSNNLYTVGNGFGFSGFDNLANASTINSTRTLNRYKSLSGFASVDLGYKSMIYLTLTGRQDYDSRFIVPGEDFKASEIGFGYPSVSTSFIFSELINKDKKNSKLDIAKLRVSWAQVAKAPGFAYATSTVYATTAVQDGWTNGYSFPYQGVSSFLLGNVQGNTGLVPEKSNEIETGLNFSFFKRRLTLDVAYYYRKTTDAILPAAISPTTGFTDAILNTGELSTNGVDVAVSGVIVKKKAVQWRMGVTFTKYKTVIDRLANGLDQLFLAGFTGTGIYHIPGEEFGQIYGGDYARTEDGTLVIDGDPTSPTYGYPLADPELRVIGNPNPDFLLGINNTIDIKRFSVSFLFDMKVGGDMWNGTEGALTFFGMSGLTENRDAPGTTSTVIDGVYGTYDTNGELVLSGGSNTTEVGLNEDWYTGNGGGFGSVASPFVQDASTYRLRNLSVSYSVPLKTTRYVKDLNVFVTGNNLLLFTPYTGIDPETSLVGGSSNGQGLDYFNMPNTRSVTFGVNIKL